MGLFGLGKPASIPSAQEALPGRNQTMPVPPTHHVNGNPLQPPFPETMEQAVFGLGCFWGAERKFWQLAGVYTTAAGHNEVVLVVYDPKEISYEELLKVFWESHNPTQGMRQGNDRGTQYRSGIYTYTPEQKQQAIASLEAYQQELSKAGYDPITTEIIEAPKFYYAEDYHQQYLSKVPNGYCGLGGTGVQFSSCQS
jgi:peptide-methionine (S)-S-oxide reductase